MAKSKKSPEERLVADMRAHFGADDVALLMREGGFAKVTEVCPTGIAVLDHHVAGIGGLPYGQITEILGVESAGKTTLLSRFMAAAQRDGCVVAFADAETSFSEDWGKLHGLDAERLVQYQPETLEDFHEQTDWIMAHPPKGRRLMIALDSIASLPTRNEMALEPKDVMAEHSRVWTQWGRQFKLRVAQQQVLVVWVNQPRSKVGVMFGPNETSFGGRWLRHAPMLRLYVSHGKGIDAHAGRYMHVRGDKNKAAPPHRSCTLKLDFRTGFDDDWATFDHAKEVGCLEKGRVFSPAAVREARANLGWPEPAAPEPAPPAREAAE